MGKLYCLMGKSSSGKDSIYKILMEDGSLALKNVVPYTTRPMRAGEADGVEYHFCREEDCRKLESEHKIIELREYNTVQGIWKYFTVDDGQIDLTNGDYLYITTLQAYERLSAHYGNNFVEPIYIQVEDGLRLRRALDREMEQENPGYEEMCRRFLADAADFSEENLQKAGVDRRFDNIDLEATVGIIKEYIKAAR